MKDCMDDLRDGWYGNDAYHTWVSDGYHCPNCPACVPRLNLCRLNLCRLNLCRLNLCGIDLAGIDLAIDLAGIDLAGIDA